MGLTEDDEVLDYLASRLRLGADGKVALVDGPPAVAGGQQGGHQQGGAFPWVVDRPEGQRLPFGLAGGQRLDLLRTGVNLCRPVSAGAGLREIHRARTMPDA